MAKQALRIYASLFFQDADFSTPFLSIDTLLCFLNTFYHKKKKRECKQTKNEQEHIISNKMSVSEQKISDIVQFPIK